jgi:hypothetical protein
MNDAINRFGDTLGHKALARDWGAVHEMLAPWMQRALDVDSVRAFFEDEYKQTLKANSVQGMHYPQGSDPQVGGNDHTNATSLREPIDWDNDRLRPVAPEVTDENMRYWLAVQLQCSDEQMEALGFDFFAEVWIAVVETPEGLRVGYWSQGAY